MTTLDVFIPGRAKPKGSLRSYGKKRIAEDNPETPTWRLAIKDAVYKRIRCSCDDQDCEFLADGFPLEGGLTVQVWLTFDRPVSVPKKRVHPVTRGTYDIDKLLRTVFDALMDARAIKDDAQIVEVWTAKAYVPNGQAPGARIRVFPAPDRAVLPTDLSPDLGRSAGHPAVVKAAS